MYDATKTDDLKPRLLKRPEPDYWYDEEDSIYSEIPSLKDATEPGTNAVWNIKFFAYRSKRKIPRLSLYCVARVRFAQLEIFGGFPKIKVKIPLVSICYIESAEKRTTLDVRGKRFRCWMMGVGKAVDDNRDWLRFLVVRQRIPHSILGLPFDWDKNQTKHGPPSLKKTSTVRSKSSEGYCSMKSPFGGSVYSLLDSVCSNASS